MPRKILMHKGFCPTEAHGPPAQLAALVGSDLQETGRRLPSPGLAEEDLREGQAPLRGEQGRGRLEGQLQLQGRLVGGLSLIHISEPTRPY